MSSPLREYSRACMWPSASRPADRLHPNAVPFPFRDEIGGVEIGKIRILDRMRQHHRTERRRVEIDRRIGAAFQPREQIEIGRLEARPHQFDVVRILVAERCRGGLGQPRRNPDPHRAGDEFQQRPAAGLVQLVEPARRAVFGSSVLPSVRSVVTTSVRVGGGGLLWPFFSPPPASAASGGEGSGVGGLSASSSDSEFAEPPPTPDPSPPLRGGRGKSATSAPPSPRDRRRNHTTARTAPDRCDP